ncbi:MAG: conjugated bile salt MFS transporter [Sarcina sp.]
MNQFNYGHTEQSSITHHKAFFMVFICMLIQAIPFSVASNIQPLFIPYVIKNYNFSLAGFSLIFTFGSLAAAICSPFLGKLFGKVNIKILFLVGTILSCGSFAGMGLSTKLYEFYIFSAIIQIGLVLFSSLGTAYLIGTWFPYKGRGEALGIAFAGGSIGNVFLQPAVSSMLGSKGPSFAYILFGILALIVSLILIIFFIRTPKTKSEAFLSESADTLKTTENTNSNVYEGKGSKETKKNKFFWIFGFGYTLIGVAISACSTQYASYFRLQLHLSAGLIGILGSVFAFFCLFGNVGGGALFDKLGSFKTMFIGFILQFIAILGMLFAGFNPIFSFLFSICYGLCVFTYMSGPAFLTTDIFGRKDSSVNLGVISLLFAVGFAIGSTIFGGIAQSIGFKLAWIVMLIFLVVGYLLLLFSILYLKRNQKKLAKEN